MGVAGCVVSAALPLAARAQETPIKFQLDWRFEGPAALFLVPAAKGYFKQEKLNVNQEELTEHLVRRAASSGMSPDQFAQAVVEGNQVQMLVGEVARGKALAVVVEAAKVVDTNGEVVDLSDEDEDEESAEAEAEAAASEGEDGDKG